MDLIQEALAAAENRFALTSTTCQHAHLKTAAILLTDVSPADDCLKGSHASRAPQLKMQPRSDCNRSCKVQLDITVAKG